MFAAVNTCSPIALTISRGSALWYATSYALARSSSTDLPVPDELNVSRPIAARRATCADALAAYIAAHL